MNDIIDEPIKLPHGTAIPILQMVRTNGFLFGGGQLGWLSVEASAVAS